MTKETFLLEEVSISCLTEDMKEELIKLHKIGTTIDEISLFTTIKFGRRVKQKELVDFLFPMI